MIYGSRVEAGTNPEDRGRIVFARTIIGKGATACSQVGYHPVGRMGNLTVAGHQSVKRGEGNVKSGIPR
jgi:hypothetical protein